MQKTQIKILPFSQSPSCLLTLCLKLFALSLLSIGFCKSLVNVICSIQLITSDMNPNSLFLLAFILLPCCLYDGISLPYLSSFVTSPYESQDEILFKGGSSVTLQKYLILDCEYLLECVQQSLGFPKNFPDFSGNYSHFLLS